MTGRKLVLAYVDSLRTDMLEKAVAEGVAPTFAKLIDRGVLIRDCASSFPSVTPVACSEMVTGLGGEDHWISGMNWYHRLEHRYVEYGSSLEATRAFGIFRSLYDLVYNMNLAHLNPAVETVFESLDDAGLRTASTPFLIYRGRHRHNVTLEGLTRRAIDVTGLKLNHHTWGPKELFYGDLYASRPLPCRSSSIPGSRDGYSSCCAAELAAAGLYDFMLLSLPDNDHHTHRYGPEAGLDSIAKADHCFAKLVEASGGMDGFLTDNALILASDHSHSEVSEELPLADVLAERWSVLRPSDHEPAASQLAVSPTGRAANVYLLGENGPSVAELREELAATDGVDLTAWITDAEDRPFRREVPGVPRASEVWAHLEGEGGEIAFRPAREGSGRTGLSQRMRESRVGRSTGTTTVRDRRGRSWQIRGALEAIEAATSGGVLDSTEYPDPLARVWSAVCSPHAGDVVVSLSPGYELVDWGGSSHVPGGSHGSLHRDDSLGPLLFVGCGPDEAGWRDQWSLRDIAPIIRGHFGAAA